MEREVSQFLSGFTCCVLLLGLQVLAVKEITASCSLSHCRAQEEIIINGCLSPNLFLSELHPFSDKTNVKLGLEMSRTETFRSPQHDDVWHGFCWLTEPSRKNTTDTGRSGVRLLSAPLMDLSLTPDVWVCLCVSVCVQGVAYKHLDVCRGGRSELQLAFFILPSSHRLKTQLSFCFCRHPRSI